MDEGQHSLAGGNDLPYFARKSRYDAVGVSRQIRIGQLVLLSLLQSGRLLVLGCRLVVSRLILVEGGGAHGVLGKELLVAGQIRFG